MHLQQLSRCRCHRGAALAMGQQQMWMQGAGMSITIREVLLPAPLKVCSEAAGVPLVAAVSIHGGRSEWGAADSIRVSGARARNAWVLGKGTLLAATCPHTGVGPGRASAGGPIPGRQLSYL